VISDRLWRRVFNADPGVLGTFYHTARSELHHHWSDAPASYVATGQRSLVVVNAKKQQPGLDATVHPPDDLCLGKTQARSDCRSSAQRNEREVAARLEKAYPDTNGQETAVVTPLIENLVGKYRTNLAMLLAAVGLVLLIACANLANLLAARGSARMKEFAVHAAVGATRGQIIKKLLLE
jgi:ABC-type antimicrobial peptide transport system, permease component